MTLPCEKSTILNTALSKLTLNFRSFLDLKLLIFEFKQKYTLRLHGQKLKKAGFFIRTGLK
jgi:hypothetical protein